jgi:hypothetical protein
MIEGILEQRGKLLEKFTYNGGAAELYDLRATSRPSGS